jgi:catechol 2,3-dioxygenase-like lactoylglutathione lyase family enzyme
MNTDQSTSSFVKLLVADAERSARFYAALGFERIQAEPPFIHLRWREQADVFLVALPAGRALEGRHGAGVLLGFRVGTAGLDDLVERARTHGASFEGPTVQPWYTRELVVTDPDGYRLNFIEPA